MEQNYNMAKKIKVVPMVHVLKNANIIGCMHHIREMVVIIINNVQKINHVNSLVVI